MATRTTPARLAVLLGLLFLLLAAPSAVLLVQTRRQIAFEAYHQYRTLADELALRIDAELQRLVAAEEARGYADYRFVVVAGDPATSTALQRSPLAIYPVRADLPGVLGYFQVAADGEFTTPLLPEDLADAERWGLAPEEFGQRVALRDELLDVLRRNALLERSRTSAEATADATALPENGSGTARQQAAAPTTRKPPRATGGVGRVAGADTARDAARSVGVTEPAASERPATDASAASSRVVASQAAFDQLNAPAVPETNPLNRQNNDGFAKVDELRITRNFQDDTQATQAQRKTPAYEQKLKASLPNRTTRREQTALVDPDGTRIDAAVRVRTFESELDPFDYSRLDDGHGVLFRKVWRNGQRTIQGLILDEDAFLAGAIVRPYEATALAQMSDLVIAYGHDVLRVQRAADAGRLDSLSDVRTLTGELLHQVRLSAPFGDVQLLWNVRHLPAGPGGRLVTWAGGVLLVLLVGTFALLYRLGLRQLNLARQQQDFVSAVSHELNTPLTSIRLYAEILSEGWADAAKQREYYAYIRAESERLSRLIANVLQLARMERRELHLDLQPVRISTLLDLLRSTLASQIERSGFVVRYSLAPELAEREQRVDTDAFLQILINLVDNALKFSARAARREIDITVQAQGGDVMWSVRDYGPGVDPSQRRKIFRLFYRPGGELTRETVGTGIGLALVRQLARAMHGEADVLPQDPGAEFVLRLPLVR